MLNLTMEIQSWTRLLNLKLHSPIVLGTHDTVDSYFWLCYMVRCTLFATSSGRVATLIYAMVMLMHCRFAKISHIMLLHLCYNTQTHLLNNWWKASYYTCFNKPGPSPTLYRGHIYAAFGGYITQDDIWLVW